MTFRDKSAFTTLDNANMENWQHAYRVWTDTHDPSVRKMMRQQMTYVKTFEKGWDMRQPEIDALNDEVELKSIALNSMRESYGKEIDRLKAENEQLRKELNDFLTTVKEE